MSGGSALIGHTGFVGGTLSRARNFDAQFNSSNIADISGRPFDLLVCAGVPAAKWIANRDPEGDRANIALLKSALDTVHAGEFILISTIDVYPDPQRRDDEATLIEPFGNHAYGANRYEFEQWVRQRFPDARIIRLPALFGEGLRKNAIFDLLNDNNTASINPVSAFQWYPTCRLADDIDAVRTAGLSIVNLFPEPLLMKDVIDAFFPDAEVGAEQNPAPNYDLRTRHAGLFGGKDGYMLNGVQVLGEMARYISAERRRAKEHG